MKETTIKDFLDGKLSDSEGLKVQLWMASRTDDSEIFPILDSYFENMGHIDNVCNIDKEYRNIEKRLGIHQYKELHNWKKFVQIATVVLIVAVTALFANKRETVVENSAWVEVNVPKGDTKSLILADGTQVHLNSGTKLLYPEKFSSDKREIIVDGEIMIDVAKDPEHPFIIRSDRSTVKVTGTKFNFKSYIEDSTIEIDLLEGSVDYIWDDKDISKNVSLKAGNLMKFEKENAGISISPLDVEYFKSFSDGRYVHFIDEPLCNIASSLERMFNVKIIIMNEELCNRRFLAFFANNESLDEMLSSLNGSQDMHITKFERTIIISE